MPRLRIGRAAGLAAQQNRKVARTLAARLRLEDEKRPPTEAASYYIGRICASLRNGATWGGSRWRKAIFAISVAAVSSIAVSTAVRAEVRTFACVQPDGTAATLRVDTNKHMITRTDTDGSNTVSYRGSTVITYYDVDTWNTLDLATGRTTHKQATDPGWVEDAPCVRK